MSNEGRFAFRIYGAIGLILLSLVFVSTSAFLMLERVVNQEKSLIEQRADDRILAGRLRNELSKQLTLMPIFILSGNAEFLATMKESQARFLEVADKLRQRESPNDRIEALKSEMKELLALGEPAIAMKRRGLPTLELSRFIESRSSPAVLALQAHVDELVHDKSLAMADAKLRMAKTSRTIITGLALISGLAFALAGAVALLSVRVLKDKRRADEERERLSLARKEAVEVVAHDLKSPLAGLMLTADMAKKSIQAGLPEGSGQYFLRIERSAKAMSDLIESVLVHSKIEAGTFELLRQDLSLKSLVLEIAEKFRPLAVEKSLRLESRIAGDLPLIKADRVRLDQAISNILSNAIKFSPKGTRVELRLWEEGEELKVSVRDWGPGLDARQLGKIFDRYWQGSGTAWQGTGLGLSIAKAIAEAHGGSISVRSSLGQGAEFCLCLPKKARGATALAPGPAYA